MKDRRPATAAEVREVALAIYNQIWSECIKVNRMLEALGQLQATVAHLLA